MIKGVVFDLDHTLFDRYATLTAIMPSFCEHFDVALSEEEAAKLLCEADKQFVHLGWRRVIEYLTEKGMFLTVPEFEEYSAFLLSKFEEYAVPYDFTKPMLRKLRSMGLKLGIITNGDVPLQSRKLEMLGFSEDFDEILISGSIGIHKPNAEPFLIMAQWLKLSPSELMYVGDNPLNDVEGSRNAGYTPVFVNTTNSWVFPEVERCELSVENVGEIPELIEKHFRLR